METIVKKYSETRPREKTVFIRIFEVNDGVVIEARNQDGEHLKDLVHIGPEGIYLYPNVSGTGLTVNSFKNDRLAIRDMR